MYTENSSPLESLFWKPIHLLQDIKLVAGDVDVYQHECRRLCACLDTLRSCLQKAVHVVWSGSDRFCERPTQRILDDTYSKLEDCSNLMERCRKGRFLQRLFSITTVAEFGKTEACLESAIANVEWLFNSVTDEEPVSVLGMPPIASTFPALSVVWSLLSKLQGGTEELREAAAIDISLMASANERNGQFIIEEGGIPLLLKALHEGTIDCNVNAATALGSLAINQKQVHEMVMQGAIPAFASILQQGPKQVQIMVVRALEEMIVHDPGIKTELGTAQGVMLLAALLLETMSDDIRFPKVTPLEVLLNANLCSSEEKSSSEDGEILDVFRHEQKNTGTFDKGHEPQDKSSIPEKLSEDSDKKKKEMTPELKTDLQVHVTRALCLLAANHLENSRKITETKAMLALATLIGFAHGEVQTNAVMAIMELAAVAEKEKDLRKSAFKMTSPAAKTTLAQLHEIICDDHAALQLQVYCIRAVGSLAKVFSAKCNDAIKALVLKLSNRDDQHLPVAVETIYALLKFIDEENFLYEEHSLAILDAPGLPFLVQLIALETEKYVQFPAIQLLSQLVLRFGQTRGEAFSEAAALSVLKSVASSSSTVKQYIAFSSKDDISQAIFLLELYENQPPSIRSAHEF